jgi:hypothetical protein
MRRHMNRYICTCLAENAEADTLANVNNNADFAQFHPVSAKAKSYAF